MSHNQATFPKNKHIAFMQLSRPNQLFENCWAEENERVVIVGLRKGDQPAVRNVVSQYAEKQTYMEDSCLGTNVSGQLKFLISKEPAKLRNFLHALSERGIITEEEKNRASHDLGLRTHSVQHAFEVGAGI